MPAPEFKAQQRQQIPREFEKRLYGAGAIAEHRLTEEVAKLRAEIEALRADIAPKFSAIVSGLEAVRAFQRLEGKQ